MIVYRFYSRFQLIVIPGSNLLLLLCCELTRLFLSRCSSRHRITVSNLSVFYKIIANMSAGTKTTIVPEADSASGAPESFKHLYENLILIDLAANLVHKKYSRDQENVIQRAKDAGQ